MENTVNPVVAARRRPDYGIDAPGVVRNLFILGALGIAAIVTRLLGLWGPRHWSAAILFPLSSAGASGLLTGMWMVWSSRFGKVRSREKYLDRLPWRGDETVLDVGCGRGLFLNAAARRLTRGGRAVGVDLWQAEDLSGNNPEATRENARLEGVADRVEVKTGDARRLPFTDASFDAVVSSMALHNIYDGAERRRAVGEMARVLKPCGRMLIVDMRHALEYARVLRDNGLADATVVRHWWAPLAMACTFGGLRHGVVVGRKSPPADVRASQ